MYAFMSYKIALLTECFITHIKNIRVLNTMCALMFYKTALLTECLITNITIIREIATICMTAVTAFTVV